MTEFGHHTAEFGSSWRETYRGLRATCPVAHTSAHGGFTVLTRYEDVRAALLDHRHFACGRDLDIAGRVVSGGVTIPTNPFRMGMMEMDPPRSQQLRKLLMPWFSAKSIAATEPHIRALTDWCLDQVIETGALDIVDDLANPLPALVTLDLLGLPLDQWRRYATILHQAAYREKGSARAIASLLDDLHAVVKARRATSADITTPLDALIAADLDDDLVVELVFMLVNGGIDTSTALIAHSVRYLADHPDDAQRLHNDPRKLDAAVHEFVRYFTPGTGVARTAIAEVALGGVTIKAGERVLLALGGANLDEAEFGDPDRVNIDRENNRHLGFGTGMHRCLGSFLAATEIAIVLERVLTRLPDLRVGTAKQYETIPLVAGFIAMPATFTPGPRLRAASGEQAPPVRSVRELQAAADVAEG